MEEKSFNKMKNEYIFFKNRLEENIYNGQISKNLIPSEDCYLIEESYIKELEESFINYSKINAPQNSCRKIESSNAIILFPLKEPKIINDFKTAINYIDNNKKISLISKKFIETIYHNNILNIYRSVIYYGGNSKLIIEFKDKKEKKALLILNPLNKYLFNENIFIIMNNQSKVLYEDILNNEDNSNLDIINIQNNFIVPFKDFINNNYTFNNSYQNYIHMKPINRIFNLKYFKTDYIKSDYLKYKNNKSRNFIKNKIKNNNKKDLTFNKKTIRPNKNHIKNITYLKFLNPNKKVINNKNNISLYVNLKENKTKFNKDLLKIFIYIFYYEKSLSEKKENIFNNEEKYCLINPQWLNDFKQYYNYEKLYKALYNNKNNLKLDYTNLDEKVINIINDYINKDNLDFNKKELSQELTDIKNITCFLYNKFNIKFIYEGKIIPIKIMNLINKWNNKIPIFPKELFFKRNNIIYINNLKIIIGNLNNENIYIPKYVFVYDSPDIFSEEKKKIIESENIKDYIKIRKCDEKDYKIQDLKNEKNEEIGKLLILINHRKNCKGTKLIIYKQSNNLKYKTNGDLFDNFAFKIDEKINNNKDRNKTNENNKTQINIKKSIFSKLVKKNFLINVVPDFNRSQNIFTKSQTISIEKNKKNRTIKIGNRNKINKILENFNNEEKMKDIIEKLKKNNDELQKKLENQVSEMKKKDEQIKKLKNENEVLKKQI